MIYPEYNASSHLFDVPANATWASPVGSENSLQHAKFAKRFTNSRGKVLKHGCDRFTLTPGCSRSRLDS